MEYLSRTHERFYIVNINFFFQESELDIGELNSVVITGNPNLAAPQMPGTTPIPTQTFTNQNFNNQTGNAPTYPTNYPPQPPPTYQTFVPAFPGFVPPNASTVQNSTVSHSVSNPTTIAPVSNSINQNLSNSNSTNVVSNKCNNITNPIPTATTNRSGNVNFSQR